MIGKIPQKELVDNFRINVKNKTDLTRRIREYFIFFSGKWRKIIEIQSSRVDFVSDPK
jgi:hypothetical protein